MKKLKSKSEFVASVVDMSADEFSAFQHKLAAIPNGRESLPCFMSEARCREFLGNISRSTLFHLRTKHGLPSIKVGGRRLYRQADVERFIIDNFIGEGK